ncbi:hypothetical protein CXB51_036196 [Gossypium anomalum]|uniref:RNase H type-1 domain-containing protein n=1 Tax=Gossypium anomalum TaxID=47600 RepID=A0A8J6CHT3_9ROSI|nr:hypothetical protein CXB51_036196 [Gossypium anomalum]
MKFKDRVNDIVKSTSVLYRRGIREGLMWIDIKENLSRKSGRKLRRDRDCVWDPPPMSWLKFNVAGVVVEEVEGYGGMLRDKKGVVSALFSSKCGACGVEQAVVMAIKVATEIFIDWMWKVNVSLIVEFELCNISDWLKYRRLRPWSVRKLFANIEGGLRHLVEIKFVVTNIQKNGMANSLANAGLSRSHFFKAYW